MRVLLILALLPAITACVSLASLDGMQVPSELRTEGRYFVRRHAEDGRDLATVIAKSMQEYGFDATATEPAEYEYLVTYIDRWYWDMRMYLIDLRIDVRDLSNQLLVATARSFQTSLAAMGQTHASVIDQVVRILAEGPTQPNGRGGAQKKSAAR